MNAKPQIRVSYRPARPPKWWPRDEASRPAYVGLLADGLGWRLGPGEWFDEEMWFFVKNELEFDAVGKFLYRIERR